MMAVATPLGDLKTRGFPWPLAQTGLFQGSFRRSLGAILLYVVVFEAALLGSGRMLQIGPFTFKMLLFTLTLFYTGWSLLSQEKLRRSTMLLTASFAAILCVGIVDGLCQGADMQLLGNDISPLLSLLTLPFFEFTIRTRHQIDLVIRTIVIATVVMVVGYSAFLAAIWLGHVPFNAVKEWIRQTGGEDFAFEPNGTVFYKGAIFIGIAFFFCVFMKRRWGKTLAAIFFLGLFMIASRGLFSAFALTVLVYVFVGPMPAVKKLIFAGIVVLVAAISLPVLFSLSGDKTESNSVRITTLSQVADRINPASVIFGHGFGNGVPERPEHMEISYVEIFHKQGALGLFWWASLITTFAFRFGKARVGENRRLAFPLFLSAVFVLFESATNPFVNNPIGMYPLLICFVGLGVLAEPDAPGSADPLHCVANRS
jgi:hypothetical protein